MSRRAQTSPARRPHLCRHHYHRLDDRPVYGRSLGGGEVVTGLRLGYTVKRHNCVVEREHQDRWRWVRDQLQREAEALQVVEQEMQERGLSGSGIRGQSKNEEAEPSVALCWNCDSRRELGGGW